MKKSSGAGSQGNFFFFLQFSTRRNYFYEVAIITAPYTLRTKLFLRQGIIAARARARDQVRGGLGARLGLAMAPAMERAQRALGV